MEVEDSDARKHSGLTWGAMRASSLHHFPLAEALGVRLRVVMTVIIVTIAKNSINRNQVVIVINLDNDNHIHPKSPNPDLLKVLKPETEASCWHVS